MRKYAYVVLALLAVAMLSGVREARALPTSEVLDIYYDCALNEVGYRVLTCGGGVGSSGQQGGAYRERVTTHCETGAQTSKWYYWNGSGWTLFSGPPGPNC